MEGHLPPAIGPTVRPSFGTTPDGMFIGPTIRPSVHRLRSLRHNIRSFHVGREGTKRLIGCTHGRQGNKKTSMRLVRYIDEKAYASGAQQLTKYARA